MLFKKQWGKLYEFKSKSLHYYSCFVLELICYPAGTLLEPWIVNWEMASKVKEKIKKKSPKVVSQGKNVSRVLII